MHVRPILALLLSCLSLSFLSTSARATCTPPAGDPAIAICTHPNTSSVTAPIELVVVTSDSAQVDLLRIYFNTTERWEKAGLSSATTFLTPVKTGLIHIHATGHDTAGRWFSSATIDRNVTTIFNACNPDQVPTQPRTEAVCRPVDGEITVSPTRVIWTTSDNAANLSTNIYLNHNKVYQEPAPLDSTQRFQTILPFALGADRLTIQGHDSSGSYQQTINETTHLLQVICDAPSFSPEINDCTNVDPGFINVNATAAAPTGIKQMQAYIDGTLAGQKSRPFLQFGTNVSSGSHQLTIKAEDRSGNWMSKSVTVTVP
jgi:hypothetical protein